MNQIIYSHWFLNNEDIAYTKKAKLINYFYDAYHIYHASKEELKASNLLTETELYEFIEKRKKCDIYGDYEKFCHGPYNFMTMEDENYPEDLKKIFDPVYGFYYIGNLPDLKKTVSIVGARRCSQYGKRIASELGGALAEAGFTVISGMARGIDSYGHRGCLDKGGKTLAVLGSGVDVIYPKENRLLYEEIAKSGAVISEYPIGMQPVAYNFPRRNRIVSALSKAVVVVEAREKSGSLITADFALDQGKDIYVVPGRIGDSLSGGCNRLATQGAGIINSIDDFIKDLQDFYGEPTVENTNKKTNNPPLSQQEMIVYSLFDFYPKSLVSVMEDSEMDYLELLSITMTLVNKGFLEEAFRNHFVISG